jgi:hypothetical protein
MEELGHRDQLCPCQKQGGNFGSNEFHFPSRMPCEHCKLLTIYRTARLTSVASTHSSSKHVAKDESQKAIELDYDSSPRSCPMHHKLGSDRRILPLIMAVQRQCNQSWDKVCV